MEVLIFSCWPVSISMQNQKVTIMGTQTSSPGDLMVLILDACHISVLDGLLCRVCFFLWHPSLLISQSMKLCQSISYLSYQVIVWITFLHLSVVSLCQLVKSPGRSVFQVYLISLLLIVIEISISSARCCLFLFFFFFIVWSYQFSVVFCLGGKSGTDFLVNGAAL